MQLWLRIVAIGLLLGPCVLTAEDDPDVTREFLKAVVAQAPTAFNPADPRMEKYVNRLRKSLRFSVQERIEDVNSYLSSAKTYDLFLDRYKIVRPILAEYQPSEEPAPLAYLALPRNIRSLPNKREGDAGLKDATSKSDRENELRLLTFKFDIIAQFPLPQYKAFSKGQRDARCEFLSATVRRSYQFPTAPSVYSAPINRLGVHWYALIVSAWTPDDRMQIVLQEEKQRQIADYKMFSSPVDKMEHENFQIAIKWLDDLIEVNQAVVKTGFSEGLTNSKGEIGPFFFEFLFDQESAKSIAKDALTELSKQYRGAPQEGGLRELLESRGDEIDMMFSECGLDIPSIALEVLGDGPGRALAPSPNNARKGWLKGK